MKKLILICLFLFIKNSYAITIKDAYVFSEEDKSSCGVSNSSSIAAVESVLRQNRIVVNDKSPIAFYINNVDIGINSNGGCAADTSLQVYIVQYVKIPSLKNKVIFSHVMLCDKGAIFSGPSYDIESRINEKLRSFTEECISEIEKTEYK